MSEYKITCRLFNGYKPCKYKRSCVDCPHFDDVKEIILIINLDAMGDVMMTTAALHPLKRKHPESLIYWITLKNAMPLLENNSLLDKVIEYNPENILIVQNMSFAAVYNGDKNQNSSSLLKSLNAKDKYGFTLSDYGRILPANDKANYSYELGLDDDLKFYKNKQTGQQILHESWGLEYKRDFYLLEFSEEEKNYVMEYKHRINPENKIVIGINTGCAPILPMKKLEISQYVALIDAIYEKYPNVLVALLGGKAESERNEEIMAGTKHHVINTPTSEGLRKGLLYLDFCDIVITGDTMAMHASIALEKYVIVFFGPSCEQEIDLFDRGVKLLPDLACSPCWNGRCEDWKCVKGLTDRDFLTALEGYFNPGTKN